MRKRSRGSLTPPLVRPCIHTVLKLHVEASAECERLLELEESLQQAGKRKQAKAARAQAELIAKRLLELEETFKRKDPHA
jgi:hypothetical protein